MSEDDLNQKLHIGINYPWLNYGWDFGDPPPAWVNAWNLPAWRAQNRQQIAADLLAFAHLGFFAVRWFLLCDGTNYGYHAEAPRLEEGRWTAEPLPREHPFHTQLVDDFEFVLRTCAELNLQFAPVLLDFHWCFPGAAPDSESGIVKGGRAEIVYDEDKRARFFDNVLEPLLDVSMKYPEAIYAWEIINEPEWCTTTKRIAPSRIAPTEKQAVPKKLMRDFIAEGARRVNSRRLPDGRAAFPSTVGFAHWNTFDEWNIKSLGLTLNQFHYYAQEQAALPPNTFSQKYSCCVGEFATAPERDWPELKRRHRAQTLGNRLRWLARKGYPAAFLWSARATDQATQWQEAEQEQLLAYLRTPNDIA